MRGFTILAAALAINAFPAGASAGPIRLAQTSIVTACMLGCNSQGSTCQSSCVVPSTSPTTGGASTNATASSTCLLNCSTLQLACQTACAQRSPSQ